MADLNEFNAQEVWVRCFNPTTNEVRAYTAEANPPASSAVQWQEVLNRIFDETENRLVFD